MALTLLLNRPFPNICLPSYSNFISRDARLSEVTGLIFTFYLSILFFKSSILLYIPAYLFSSQSLWLLFAFMLLSCLTHIHHLRLFSLRRPLCFSILLMFPYFCFFFSLALLKNPTQCLLLTLFLFLACQVSGTNKEMKQ